MTAVVAGACLAAPAAASPPVVATVTSPAATATVTEAQLAHWRRVARASAGAPVPRRALDRDALQLLISFAWIEGEAGEQGITVGDAEVRRSFEEQRRESFPKRADYRRFLRQTHQTEADIVQRIRLDLLSNRIRDRVKATAPPVTEADIDARMRAVGPDVVPQERDIRLIHTRTRAGAVRARARVRGHGIRRGQEGEFLEEDYGTAVERAVFRAARGRVVGPVRGRDGYVVFEVVRIHPRHVMPVAEERAEIRDALVGDTEQKTLDTWISAFTAKWRSRTTCAPAYVWHTDCGNWDGTPAG